MVEEFSNIFFYHNTCHICKIQGYKTVLKKCGKCKMISYCSKEHQKKHWLQHKDLCHVLIKILSETNKSNLFEGMKNSNMTDWVKAKMKLIFIVIVKLKRQLLPYEEEMFKFPKACIICHETNSKLLTDCPLCPSSSFCEDHKYDSNHSKICKMFTLCYDLDMASILFTRYPPNINFYRRNMVPLPTSMKNFIDKYINNNKPSFVSNDVQISQISEYLTRPLSLLFAIERLKFLESDVMTVHIIGANMMEVHGIEIWEILLHWLQLITTLNIILVGPEFKNQYKKTELKICDCCNAKRMKLYYETHGVLYDEYVNSSYFIKPNITIGYNLGIHEYEDNNSEFYSWHQCVQILQKQNCPFILTSYNADEAQKDYKRICNFLKQKVTYLYCEKNPFSSLRPHRDYETDSCYYQNQYLIIYKNLNS